MDSEQKDNYNTIATSSTISIQVESEAGNVEDALVNISGLTGITDQNGITILRNVPRTELGFSIQVSKAGYIPITIFVEYDKNVTYISRSIKINSVEPSKLIAGQEDVLNGFGVNNMYSIEIDKSKAIFLDQDVEVSREDVQVFVNYTQVTGLSFQNQRILSYSSDHTKEILSPSAEFTILAIDQSGSLMNLAEGSELSFVITDNFETALDEEVQKEAYALSEVSGLFYQAQNIEPLGAEIRGTINQLGTFYIGNSRSEVTICVNLESTSNVVLAHVPIVVVADGTAVKTTTDHLGKLCFSAEAGAEIQLKINTCGVEESLEIGSFDAGVNLDKMQIDVNAYSLNGTISECNSQDGLLGYLAYNQGTVGYFEDDGQVVGTWICNTDSICIDIVNTETGNTNKDCYLENIVENTIQLGNVILGCGRTI